MKVNKIPWLIGLFLCCILLLTGCWNYKEPEQLGIIAGTAIDKNEDGTVHLTMEIVDVGSGGQVSYKPVYIESDGETLFEAARRAITQEGKKLYWSHAKVVIVSQDIAKGDLAKYLDFLFRDAESREDIWLLVSTEKTAEEILTSTGELKPIVSFQIDDTMREQKQAARFPKVELFEFFDRLFYKNVSPILPTVKLIDQNGQKTPQVEGTAIFKDRKLVGFLPVEHTKCLLWLRNEVKDGLVVIENAAGTKQNVSLEIYKSKSRITPVMEGDALKMKVDIRMDVSIGEVMGSTDLISGTGKDKLIADAEKKIEKKITEAFYMVRDNYDADIFGFGRHIDMKMPQLWNQIQDNWDEMFKNLELDVSVHIKIRGSATTRTTLKAGK